MGLRINTNIQALQAHRKLQTTNHQQAETLQRLSSGARINKSADDAAGLAIAEKMRGSIRSMKQGIRNANDGISMIQTAEGALNEVGNILIRFRELSIQAASDTIGDTERSFIDKEVQHLRQEIDRIAASTEYNGTKLLNSDQSLDVHVGLNNSEIDRHQLNLASINVTGERIGVTEINTATKEASQLNLAKVDDALKKVMTARAEMGALQNRMQSGINNMMIYHENLSNSRSRIYDADMAVEASDLAKFNILSNAGVSVMSQANSNPGLALKLL